MELTLRWARRCKDYFAAHKTKVPWNSMGEQALFGIVQGGMHADLRRESAERTVAMEFDGYAIGGLSVGESREKTREMIARTLEFLPKDRPRYVMGVGYPEEIVLYANMGVEMMDCVLPTRAARHGCRDLGDRDRSVLRRERHPGPAPHPPEIRSLRGAGPALAAR